MKIIRFIFLQLVFVLAGTLLYAQRPGYSGTENLPKVGYISGTVIDKSTGKPVEYANVVLFKKRDSTMFTGGITDQSGFFEFKDIPYGMYFMDVKFIGYDKITVPKVPVFANNKSVNLGEIKIQQAASQIDEVAIVAERNQVEYKIDRKVINVAQDIQAAGGTAVEVLENTPSVQVDVDGNVSLRGSTNFTVLIDGKPSVLSGTEALEQIPSSSIEQIEIITNPSAKYDPDGIAGIINIIVKKNHLKGLSGLVNVSIGTREKYGSDFQINYRSNKFNAFVGADYRDATYHGSRSEKSTILRDSTVLSDKILHSDGNRTYGRGGTSLKTGLDFYVTPKTTLSVSGRFGNREGIRDGDSKTHLFYEPATADTFYISENNTKRGRDYYEINTTYNQQFSSPDHQLTALVQFSDNTGKERENQNELYTTQDWILLDENPALVRTGEDENGQDLRIKADYQQPLKNEGKFEAGIQFLSDREHEDYSYEKFDYDLQEWFDTDSFSSAVDFVRDIYSAYSTFGGKFFSIEYQLGLRGEYTYRSISQPIEDKEFVIDRFDVYPTVHLSIKLPGDNQLLASYSRRVHRPRGRDLEPFKNYYNSTNVRVGNPSLQPEYIDSYEINWQKRFGASSFTAEGYYRITNNKITRFSIEKDGIIEHTRLNLNKDYALGIELMGNLTFSKKLMMNTSFTFYNYRIEGNIIEGESTRESNNWHARLNAFYKMTPTTRFQVSGYYRGPTITTQGERDGFLITSAAVKQQFFKKSLTASLSIKDIFGTIKFKIKSSSSDLISEYQFQRESQVVTLTLSYKINNYKSKNGRNGEGGDESGGDFEGDF